MIRNLGLIFFTMLRIPARLTKLPLKPISRSLYKKPIAAPGKWTKSQIDAKVFEVLYDYSKVPDEKVTLYSSLSKDLLADSDDKY